MGRSLGVGVVFALVGTFLVAAPAAGVATGMPGFEVSSSEASQVTATKKPVKGTLKIAVTGSGTYTIKGKGFRKVGHASKTYKVRPGRYKVTAQGAAVTPGKVRVRARKTARVRVTFPVSGQNPTQTPPTDTPTPTPTPTTPPPTADVALSRKVNLSPGSVAVVDLGPDLESLTSLTGIAVDGPVTWSESGGGLMVSVVAGTVPGVRQVVATGLGCVAVEDCARSVSVTVEITVLPLQAPPDVELTAVVPPSPDRVAQAQNVSEGIDVLADEATIVVEASDPAAGRLVADAAGSAVGAVVVSGLSEAQVFQLRWTDQQDIKSRLAALVSQPGVRSAEAGLLVSLADEQVGADDEPEYGGDPWNLKAINADAAWGQGVTGRGVTIGVLELDGVVSGHEDLPSASYPAGSKPVAEHPTKVAGMACAKDNGKGVIGVAPECSLVSVRANQDKKAYLNGYLNNLTQMVKAGARVINNSFGVGLGCKPYAGQWGNPPKYYPACGQQDLVELQQILDGYSAGSDNAFASWLRTTGRDTVVVIAAGNDALPEPTNLWSHFAARGGATNVLTVASTDRNGNLSFFSDYGPHVDVAAPGGGVKSTIPGNKYATDMGTSFAAPMVAGAAALIKQQYPALSGSQVAYCLRANARTFVAKRNDKDGLTYPYYGQIPQLDVGQALQCGIDPPAHPKTVNSYIARDPTTGRSVLVEGGTVNVIGDAGLYNCLARTRAVWDIVNLKVLHWPVNGVQLNCYDEGPAWTYTPTAQGGNTGTNIILRDSSGKTWLINAAGQIQTIPNASTYQCLARSNPVIWNVPSDKIAAWTPSAAAAICGPISVAAACVSQYGSGSTAQYRDFNDPYSWYCTSPQPPYGSAGGVDLNLACSTQYGSGATAYLGENNAYGWHCERRWQA
jgi:hypothetical protein